MRKRLLRQNCSRAFNISESRDYEVPSLQVLTEMVQGLRAEPHSDRGARKAGGMRGLHPSVVAAKEASRRRRCLLARARWAFPKNLRLCLIGCDRLRRENNVLHGKFQNVNVVMGST